MKRLITTYDFSVTDAYRRSTMDTGENIGIKSSYNDLLTMVFTPHDLQRR